MTKADTSRSWTGPVLGCVLAVSMVTISVSGGAYAVIPRGEAFVIAWWVLALGLALGLLPRARLSRPAVVALLALGGLAAWTAVGLAWTESAERTVTEVTRVLGLAGFLAVITGTFTSREWRAAAVALAVTAGGVCVVGLVSRLAPDLLRSPLVGTPFERRLAYPLNYWNALGAWAAMTVGLALAWSVHAPRWWLRGAALGTVCVAVGVAYLTYSRTAVLSIALAVGVVVVVPPRRWLVAGHVLAAAAGTAAIVVVIRAHPDVARGTGADGAGRVALVTALVVLACLPAARATWGSRLERARMPAAGARRALLACAAVTLVAAVAIGPSVARAAWRSFEGPDPAASADPAARLASLGSSRRELWETSLRAFARHPFGGTGAGTYEFVQNRAPSRTSFVRDGHSLYLEILGEQGLPGLLLVLAALGALVAGCARRAWRQADDAGAGAAAGCM